MPTEYWMLGLLVAVAAIVIGFAIGRISAPGEKQSRKLSEELEDKRAELKGMRTNLNHHFEESARLFGALAYDYRALYAHLSDSAHRLGLTEGETRALLEPADRQFLARDAQHPEIEDSDVDEGQTRAETEATAATTRGEERSSDSGDAEHDSTKQDDAATPAPSAHGEREASVDLTKTDAEHPAASPEPPATARDTKPDDDTASEPADKNDKERKRATG